jgi:hypothetical protein
VTNINDNTALRALLLAAAAVGLALGMTLMSPAAAFVNEDADDGASEEPAGEPADEPTGEDDAPGTDEADGNGFVNGDEEAAPVGGVDAGFGGGADQGGLGAPHAAAISLLGLALAGHAANARRLASDRA